MRAETFFVKYISVHNCFLHFSERWLGKFKDTNSLVSYPYKRNWVVIRTKSKLAIAEGGGVKTPGLALRATEPERKFRVCVVLFTTMLLN
jgi:hypothetical protein